MACRLGLGSEQDACAHDLGMKLMRYLPTGATSPALKLEK